MPAARAGRGVLGAQLACLAFERIAEQLDVQACRARQAATAASRLWRRGNELQTVSGKARVTGAWGFERTRPELRERCRRQL